MDEIVQVRHPRADINNNSSGRYASIVEVSRYVI